MKVLPKGFTYLEDVDATILQEMRYAQSHNFVGRPIPGYKAPRCILTIPTALALKNVQTDIAKHHLRAVGGGAQGADPGAPPPGDTEERQSKNSSALGAVISVIKL